MTSLKTEIEIVFTKYFENIDKKEMLKNKEYEKCSKELTELLIKKLGYQFNKLRNYFYEEFIPLLKKYNGDI